MAIPCHPIGRGGTNPCPQQPARRGIDDFHAFGAEGWLYPTCRGARRPVYVTAEPCAKCPCCPISGTITRASGGWLSGAPVMQRSSPARLTWKEGDHFVFPTRGLHGKADTAGFDKSREGPISKQNPKAAGPFIKAHRAAPRVRGGDGGPLHFDETDRGYLQMAVELSRGYRDDQRRPGPVRRGRRGRWRDCGTGVNRVIELHDPTAHAEVMALRATADPASG